MAEYQVNWDPVNKIAYVDLATDAAPASTEDLGEFEWTPGNNADGYDDNVTIFHFVRDKLYLENVEDMQSVQILLNRVRSIEVGTPVNIAVAATSQINTVFTPVGIANNGLTYVSSNPAVATVSSTGLITGVSAGTANITVTSNDGAKTDIKVVTVT